MWSYGSWIYNFLCNQFLSPLMWVRISIRARCTTLCIKVCQWLVTGRWFSQGPLVSSNNKTDRHYITEVLLKEALNTIKLTYNIRQPFTSSPKIFAEVTNGQFEGRRWFSTRYFFPTVHIISLVFHCILTT